MKTFTQILDGTISLTEAAGWLDVARKVVKDHQMVYINPKNNKTSEDKKKGFTILDATTANMLVQVADALGKVNHQKFTGLSLTAAVNLGWQVVKRSEARVGK